MDFKTIKDLQKYLRKVDKEKVTGFNCKYELFIHEETDEGYRVLWNAYYGTNNACEDICSLLGIKMEEV